MTIDIESILLIVNNVSNVNAETSERSNSNVFNNFAIPYAFTDTLNTKVIIGSSRNQRILSWELHYINPLLFCKISAILIAKECFDWSLLTKLNTNKPRNCHHQSIEVNCANTPDWILMLYNQSMHGKAFYYFTSEMHLFASQVNVSQLVTFTYAICEDILGD